MIEAEPNGAFLVKARGGQAALKAAAGAPAEPLFPNIEQAGQGLAAAGASRWYRITPPLAAAAGGNGWDAAHAMFEAGLAAGAGAPEFVEPDLSQRWRTDSPGRQALAMARACGASAPQDPSFPRGDDPFWFQDADHGEFAAARAAVPDPGAGRRVRIAHLDTGYDPGHHALPPHLNRARQRNFVDPDRPGDASDTSGGIVSNLGHGTGTISILAGQLPNGTAIGGAPLAEVVPIRVANSVVLFANSAVAQALDYVYGLCGQDATAIDVVTMSMGGLASQAWAEAVNALYEKGVFIVAAAGNNIGNFPTRHIVYPARFGRVAAACGAMANHAAYADLGFGVMAGNYGPDDKMATALCAFTPNTPWARLGCPDIVDGDGSGTSAATPQVAAAAALYVQRHRAALDRYPQGWMRAEAIRAALFGAARLRPKQDLRHFGRGEIRAAAALAIAPPPATRLRRQPADEAGLPLLQVLTGLGAAAPNPAQARMLALEMLQISQRTEVAALLDEAGQDASHAQALAAAIAGQPGASTRLRKALGQGAARSVRGGVPSVRPGSAIERLHLAHALSPPLPTPATRRLRVFAYDPILGSTLDTLDINEAVIEVPWEEHLEPGPVGEYLEVIDVDPASGGCYAPVNLSHPHLLVADGLRPSEANPQFHQQMVYAVAMRTIHFFEEALGRTALWAPRLVKTGAGFEERYVQQLRIYPHAIRAENSFYSPERRALLLGYFTAAAQSRPEVPQGSTVFCALSHDIVAHETTHALLDGLHRRYKEATNPDVLAFHEAFADIVALFQHFTMPESLRAEMARMRAEIGQRSLLAKLAVQFGLATGHESLRSAIESEQEATEAGGIAGIASARLASDDPHERGSVLVAAVFDAFVQIYRQRAAEPIRLATNGTGILPPGDLPAALIDKLAWTAAKAAGHVLTICIRALDYCPPVDPTFGDYLRAIVTADSDLVPDDKRSYRVAFVSAFRARGILPANVRHLSVDSLVWEPPPLQLGKIRNILGQMSLSWDRVTGRDKAFEASRHNAKLFHDWLVDPAQVPDDEMEALGLVRDPASVKELGGRPGTLGGIEVHSVRPARRIGPDGQSRSDLVIEITQTFRLAGPGAGALRGGCTLLVDLETRKARYFVRKKVMSRERLDAQLGFAWNTSGLRDSYVSPGSASAEPFALLHSGQ